jgi:amino-acid N-acetyltransferase
VRIDIRPATPRDLPSAIELLRSAGLPTEDLTAEHLALVAEGEAGVLGVIGLEAFGDIGLLRSLVVSPLARGAGVGRSLVAALESAARKRGIAELWLLTQDADAFFSKSSFCVRKRDAAPEAIRGSEEFSRLCPDDAVLMSKRTGSV